MPIMPSKIAQEGGKDLDMRNSRRKKKKLSGMSMIQLTPM
jgi:hypothetical protein